jgi:hypothetical protein
VLLVLTGTNWRKPCILRHLMRDLLWDLRYAIRRLAHEPLVSLAAAVTLALGVSATVVMGDIVDHLLLRPPPHVQQPGRVVRMYDASPNRLIAPLRIGWESLQVLTHQAPGVLDAVAAYLQEDLSLGRGAGALKVRVVTHSDDYFRVLGVVPVLGRLPAAGDRAAPQLAVISHGLWQRVFGSAPDVLGRTVDIGVHTFEIAGVTPRGFVGVDAEPTDIWCRSGPGVITASIQDGRRGTTHTSRT